MNEDEDLLRRLAALPREMEPAGDLWPEIAARVNRRRHRPTWPFAVPAVAAAAALAVALGLFSVHTDGGFGLAVDPALADAFSFIAEARADLGDDTLALLAGEHADGLTTIERLTAALERHPDDPELQRQLLDAYRGQVLHLDYLGRAPRGVY